MHLEAMNLSDELQDSSSNSLSGFEGPEKLLEVWFKKPCSLQSASGKSFLFDSPISTFVEDQPSVNVSLDNYNGLRSIKKEAWQEMLDLVKCQILSLTRNEYADAYLLRCVIVFAML